MLKWEREGGGPPPPHFYWFLKLSKAGEIKGSDAQQVKAERKKKQGGGGEF